MKKIRALRHFAERLGPYLLLELLLPGGTLFALLLYLYRNGHFAFLADARRVAGTVGESLGSELEQLSLALQPAYQWPEIRG